LTLLIGGAVKIVYDLLLLALFRRIRPPEEEGELPPMQPAKAGRG